jgi:hypothetical protein
MGQHKTNPTAILAKQLKLPPKEKPMSKKEVDALILAKMLQKLPIGWFEERRK